MDKEDDIGWPCCNPWVDTERGWTESSSLPQRVENVNEEGAPYSQRNEREPS